MKSTEIRTKQRILIVDDSEMNRAILADMLGEGYEILEAENGLEAVAYLKKLTTNIDLLLLDIMMPLMDGYEATRQIRKLDRTDAFSIPIIALTANAFAEDVRHALDCGMNAHLAKPLDVKKMIHTIACYCSRVCISH